MNSMNKEDLLKMIEDDDLDLLSIKPVNSSVMTADERLVSSFQEINEFVRKEGHEPVSGGEIREHQLATRLKSLREDVEKVKSLEMYDELELLKMEQKPIHSFDDIFQDDDLGLLDNTDEDLFHLKNVPTMQSNRNIPELIARRQPCKDFASYEGLFKNTHQQLQKGEFKLKKLQNHKQFYEGIFFVLGGLLGYIEKIYDLRVNEQSKLNGRLRIIFENGTESNMLLQSLVKALQDYDGWLVSKYDNSLIRLASNNDDISTGFIYILKSLTQDEKIKGLKNLYKIGFSNIPVEERIKNASQEPTYLMAPVSIVSTFECYNFNPQKLEQLLHNFFGSACLNIDIFDAKNQRHSPREWFIASLSIIEKAVELIISGAIVNYKYDVDKQEIVLR